MVPYHTDNSQVDGEFSGPAVDIASSSREARYSSRDASRSAARASITASPAFLMKRVVVEMSSGLTCNGVAAVTLTDPNASAQLASATSAADAAGITEMSGMTEAIMDGSTDVGGESSVDVVSTSDGNVVMTTSGGIAGAQNTNSASPTTSTNAAMRTQAPVLLAGGVAAAFIYGAM